jgi:hypothetical protein
MKPVQFDQVPEVKHTGKLVKCISKGAMFCFELSDGVDTDDVVESPDVSDWEEDAWVDDVQDKEDEDK